MRSRGPAFPTLLLALALAACSGPRAEDPAPAAAETAADPAPAAAPAPAPEREPAAPVAAAPEADDPLPEAAAPEAPAPQAPAPAEAVAEEPAPLVPIEVPDQDVTVGGEAASIVLARVNGVPLTLEDALSSFQGSHGGHEMLVRGERAVRELTSRLIEEQVFLEEALALGLDEAPEVQVAVEEFRRKQAELVFWRDEVEEGVTVSEEEVEAAWARTEAAASIVLIEVPERADAEALRARVEAGEDIRELAAEHSTHESASFGGELPLVQMGALEPALDAAVFALHEPGSLTPVVETEGGAAFALLVERIENRERAPREQALPTIRSILLGSAQDARRAELVDGFCAAAGMEVFPERVTRDALLATDAGDTVLARCGEEDFTLEGLRQLVDMDAVRAADAKTVESAMRDLVHEWAERRAIRLGVEHSGLFEDPEVQEKTASFGRDALLAQLHQEYVYAGIQVDEGDVRAWYDAHLEDEFTTPPEVRLAYIVTETLEQAQEAIARLEAGDAFAVVAREMSIDPTSQAHGGRAGWVKPDQVLPEVAAVAFELAAGERSGPVETEVGVFVLEALERKDAQPIPFTAAWRSAQRGAVKDAQRAARAEWVARLRERADVVIDEDGVARAVALLEQQALAKEAAEAAAPPTEAPGGASPHSPHGAGRKETP